VALVLLVAGCVARAPRSLAPEPEARIVPTGSPRTFTEDRCGPGSLSAVLNALGDSATEQQLDLELPKVKGGGVLSLDLVLAARRRGFDAALVTGDAASLRREIEAGRAAILMLRLLDAPGRGKDVYHYVVVDGFDPGRTLFRFQFGDGRFRWVRLPEVEGSWKPAGHVLVRVRAAVPSLAEGLRRGVDLERQGRADEAAEVYRELLEVHPESARLLTNLGNVEAARGRRPEAETAFRAALRIVPGDRDALNNLAWLLREDSSRLDEAEALAARAAGEPGPDQGEALDTLGRVQLARGRCHEAASTFARGIPPNPQSGGVSATLLEGLGQARLLCGELQAAEEAFEAALLAGPRPDTERAARAGLASLSPDQSR
jgi:tetratricopeptide (TPR) repeat protein